MGQVQVSALKKYYRQVHALDGLDLDIPAGTIFGFLGPNGAGKTTTLRILTGLALPTSGTAQVAGIDVVRERRRLPQHIGHLPEEPAFYTWMTPLEFLDYLGRLYGLPSSRRKVRVKQLLELVHLDDVSKRRIAGFSRGMRQRLGIAAAILHQPEVLFLDEPASALDPAGRKEVLDLIANLRGQATVVMSTHILADVERVCDVIGIISKGRMLALSPRQELLDRYAIPAFELEPDDPAVLAVWAAKLRLQPWVISAVPNQAAIRITVKDKQVARQELLALALQFNLMLKRFEEVRPSLEDVFLQLVGEEQA